MSLLKKAKGLASEYINLEKDDVQQQREITETIESKLQAEAEDDEGPIPSGWGEGVDYATAAAPGTESEDVAVGQSEEAGNWGAAEAYDATTQGDEHGSWGYDAQAYGAEDPATWAEQGVSYDPSADAAGYGQWGEPAAGADTVASPDMYPASTDAAPASPDAYSADAWSQPKDYPTSPEPPAAPASPIVDSSAPPEPENTESSEGISKLARLSKRVKEQQQKIQRMEQQAFVDGKKIHDLREMLAKKDLDMAPTLEKLEWHKKELASLKAEAADICKGAVLNWQIRAEQSERSLDEAQRNLKQRDNECESLRQDLEELEEGFRRKLDKLQAELDEAKRETEMLKAKNAKLEQAHTEAVQLCEEKNGELKRLQDEIWKKQEDILTLQRQNQELGESGLQAKFRVKLEEAERCHKRALDMMTQKMLQEVEHMKQELEQVTAEKEQLVRHQDDFRTFLKPSMRGISRPMVHAPTAAKPAPEKAVDTELAVKWDYLRGILLQFLQNSDPAFRRRLLPILATVLQLDHYELHSIYLANRQWVLEPDSAGCGTFLSAFLRPAAR